MLSHFPAAEHGSAPADERFRTVVFGIYDKGLQQHGMGLASAEAVFLFVIIADYRAAFRCRINGCTTEKERDGDTRVGCDRLQEGEWKYLKTEMYIGTF
jgi:hypothetical protein